jgi:hypothetical protein
MHEEIHKEKNISKLSTITIGVDEIQDYKEAFITTKTEWEYKNGPVFLEIPWKNKRIISQKGYFTFHSTEIPIEELLDKDSGLLKIEIKRSDRTNIIEEFKILGVTEHDIYSDLTSLGQYFSRIFEK